MEATVAERGQITLPKAVRDALGLTKGTLLKVELDEDARVIVEGHAIGHLEGFRFVVDVTASGEERKLMLAAAERHLPGLLAEKARRLVASELGDLRIDQAVGPAEVGGPAASAWRLLRIALRREAIERRHSHRAVRRDTDADELNGLS